MGHEDSPQIPFQEGLVAWAIWSADGLQLLSPFRGRFGWNTHKQWVIEGIWGRLSNGPQRHPCSESANLLPDMTKVTLQIIN